MNIIRMVNQLEVMTHALRQLLKVAIARMLPSTLYSRVVA